MDSANLAARDTTIYKFADERPRFPTQCERYDTTASAKSECSDIAVLRYVNERAGYPLEARQQNITGMAVIGFLVEANGYISQAEILKDPGGGLGLSALRAVAEMAREVRWRPAVVDSQFVRFFYTLPVRFKLEEPKPYVVTAEGDSVYVQTTTPVQFNGTDGKFGTYFDENITYPASGNDSCRLGQLDLQLLVRANGEVEVQDIIDYNDLGTDFTFNAIKTAVASTGQWTPAQFEGRPVTTAYDIKVNFAPDDPACATVLDRYNTAVTLMNEGQTMLADSATLEQGLAKMDLAVTQFPRDGYFRIVRGQARMDANKLTGACEDLRFAKEIALIDWFDAVLPLLCRGN